MSIEEFLKVQTYSLKVNIHCEGCKRKVKKILQKIEGVYIVKLEAEWGKVTVSGEIESETLIRQLNKHRKHAQLIDDDLPDNGDAAVDGDDDVIDGNFDGDFGGGSPPQGVSCLPPQATAKIPIDAQSFPPATAVHDGGAGSVAAVHVGGDGGAAVPHPPTGNPQSSATPRLLLFLLHKVFNCQTKRTNWRR